MPKIDGRYVTGSFSDQRFLSDGIAAYFAKIIGNGVAAKGTNLAVTVSFPSVFVNYGDAWIDGFLFRLINDGSGVCTLTETSGTRKDRVVVRKDMTIGQFSVYIKTGTSGSPPALEASSTATEISLAQLTISGTSVTIADERYLVTPQLLGLPVGSIVMRDDTTDPGTIVGGTWTRIKDVFLLGAGDTYALGATGGAATVTLSNGQIPLYNLWMSSNSFTPGLSIAVNGGSAYGLATQNAGGGEPHNNMPPYKAVYIWKRTA